MQEAKVNVLKKLLEKYSNKKVVLKEDDDMDEIMTTSVEMVLLSHLSDIGDGFLDKKDIKVRAEFCKYLLLNFGSNIKQDINASKVANDYWAWKTKRTGG